MAGLAGVAGRTTGLRWVGTAVAAVLVATGCSPESALERVVERQTGEDVDFDFSSGNFRIETDEGIVEYSADGTFRLVTADGEVITGSAKPDGSFEVMGPDGEMITGGVNADGAFQVEGPDGEMITSDDGQVVVTGDDGTAEFGSSSELPEDFPSAVPLPDGFEPDYAGRFAQGDEVSFTVVGPVAGSVGDVAGGYRAAVAAAGFEITSEYSSGDVSGFTATSSQWSMTVSVIDDSGTAQLSLVVIAGS